MPNKPTNHARRLVQRQWRVEMTLVESTCVEAATKEEAIEKAMVQGFGGTTRHIKTVARPLSAELSDGAK